jgi:hypothetical protein
MTTAKKTLALLAAVERASADSGLDFGAQLAATSSVTGVDGQDALNLLRQARIEQCITEMDALADEVVRLRSAIERSAQASTSAGDPGPEPTPAS